MWFQLTQLDSRALREPSDLPLLLVPGFLGTSQQRDQAAIFERIGEGSCPDVASWKPHGW